MLALVSSEDGIGASHKIKIYGAAARYFM